MTAGRRIPQAISGSGIQDPAIVLREDGALLDGLARLQPVAEIAFRNYVKAVSDRQKKSWILGVK